MRTCVAMLLAALALSGCAGVGEPSNDAAAASGCTEVRDEHEADRRGLQRHDPDTMQRVADRIEERPECFSTTEWGLVEYVPQYLEERRDTFADETPPAATERVEDSPSTEDGDDPRVAAQRECPGAQPATPPSGGPGRPQPETPPAQDVRVTVGDLPAGFQHAEPAERGFANLYEPPLVTDLGLRTWSDTQLLAKGSWPEAETYIAVTAVESTREVLCVILREAAAERDADGRSRARTVEVRGRRAILHPAGGPHAASLLLWMESDELMIQLLPEYATVDELVRVAEGLHVEVTPPAP